MKKLFAFCCIIFIRTTVLAQPGYPAAPPPPVNLSKMEYFIDADPGVGNGKPVTLSASQNINTFSFNADLTGVPNGFHRVYLRSMDAAGKWSLTNNAFFDNFIVPAYAIAPAAGNITEVEYFIDVDPGVGNGSKIPLAPGQDLSGLTISINVTGLSTGVHRLYIRSKDIDGKWSLTDFGVFDNSFAVPYPTAPAPAPPVGEMEYFIDTDPGFGNGTPIIFTAGTDISNLSIDIPLNNITQGRHTLYIRSRQNPWSFSAYAEFLMGSVLPVTWLYIKGMLKDETAIISWATAMEENTKEFIVEYSENGNDFKPLGQTTASGNSSASKTYSFVHNTPVQGFNYYRIKQVDIDGRFSYSKIINLFKGEAQKTTMVGPNPVNDVLHVIESKEGLLKKIEVFDMNGRVVMQRNVAALNRVFSITTSFLPKGNYVLKLFYADKSKSFKITKE
jgi:hypothetical protein